MFELRLICPVSLLEAISDALDDLDTLSQSIEDFDAQTPQENPIFGEPGMPVEGQAWNRSRIAALFDSEKAADDALLALRTQEIFASCLVEDIVEVPDQDWVRLTQSQFAPVEVAPTFWIVPSWSDLPPDAKTIIHLDPGLAFGTGTHPTTFMCLRWISNYVQSGQHVLDYGCGSGILAIAAAKFGATEVVGVDIDSCAISATLSNAEVNAVTVLTQDADTIEGQFDVVIANILAQPLINLAQVITSHISKMGKLVLSGILREQAGEIAEAYRPYISLEVTDTDYTWVLMTGEKVE